MTGLWMDLAGRAGAYSGLGILLYLGARVVANELLGPTTCAIACGECLGDIPDCSSCDGSGEDPDDTDSWDRGHDEYMDRGNVL